MSHKRDIITLVFSYDQGKPIKFIRSIERGDYETFYAIVRYFFTDELFESDIDAIIIVYPDLESILIDDDGNYYTDMTLQKLFDRYSMISDDVTTLNENVYKINWST